MGFRKTLELSITLLLFIWVPAFLNVAIGGQFDFSSGLKSFVRMMGA